MAKRYHESRGSVHHAKDKFNDEHRNNQEGDRSGDYKPDYQDEGYYIGMEPRRRQEMQDAGMIREDHRAIANMPQEVMIKPYPKTGPYMPEGLNDDIRGVDADMDFDDSKRREHMMPKKV